MNKIYKIDRIDEIMDGPMTRLTELRVKKGWSQEKLSLMIGVSGTALRKWEKGQAGIGLKAAIKLAIALDCEILDLIEWEEKK